MKGTTQKVWGLRPETLAVISKLAAGDVTVEQVQAEHQAAVRGAQVTGGVAVLPLRGLITPRPSFLSLLFGGGGGLQSFRQSFHDALNSDDISAILIDIDSPGGLTDLVPETAAEIRAARGTKPIVAIANTMAASAAYWIAAQADELVVSPSGEVGSIGVFMAHEDWSKFDDDLGVKTTLISAGKYKTEGNPYEPLTDEARGAFQETVDDLYAMFAADVAKGRGVTAAAVKAGYGEGRMALAQRAIAADMADRIDTFEGTVARLVRRPPRSRKAAAEDLQGNPEPNSILPATAEAEQRTDEEAEARTRKARELMFPRLPA